MAVVMFSKTGLRVFVALLLFSGFCRGAATPALLQQSSTTLPAGQMQVTIMDQNGVPLEQVYVIVQQNDKTIAQVRTTPTGIAVLRQLAPGTYKLVVEKQGFYTSVVPSVVIVSAQTSPVEVRLQPVREYKEEIEVTTQASPIDPDEIANSNTITAGDISNIPYPVARDYRNVLPYIPGVVGDRGQIHIAGASTQEIQDYLDGFEVSQPATGALGLRVNPDSLRKVDVRSSRYSAAFGKGSGGLVDLQLQDGDNKFRVNATDLVPTVQNVKGIQINNWTPRGYFSGPLVRDKVWFDLSHEGETDYNVIKQLPDGADTNTIWRIDDLARLRMNLSPGNVLTASALVNMQDSQNTGITEFDPVSVSLNNYNYLYVLGLKDQISLGKATMLEIGASYHRNKGSSLPMGEQPYVLGPDGRSGNYFVTNENISSRTQAFANLFLKPWNWMGTHQFTVGGRADKVLYDAQIHRGAVQFVDGTDALLRQVTFTNTPGFGLSTVELSSFLQDRWTPFQRMIIEPGVRWDHDSYLQQSFVSPRIAGTMLVSQASETKISAGIGIYYDRTNLALASNSSQGMRTDQFFSPDAATFPAIFTVNPQLLAMPRYVNWSAAIERRLPGRVYARLEYISRHGEHGWSFEEQPGNIFELRDDKKDRFDGAQITLRKELKRGYPVQVSYMRSRATSNQTVDFAIDALLIGNQVGGALPWDAPNQLNAWGTYPLPWKFKKFDLSMSSIWHTGFTFVTINQFGQIVSGPGEFRFPDFFTLNAAIERKFTFKGYLWAGRIGLANVTNQPNPFVVDNNINSPTFLSFFGTDHRTLAGRIRFLGKAEPPRH
jgi:hypothetical protein